MFSRIGRFFKAIFNAILGEAESQVPVAMLEEWVREMLDNLRALREATATTIAFETKAKRDLGYHYTVKFEDGERRCIDWLRANRKIEDCAHYPFYDRIIETWRRHSADNEH